MKQYMESVLPYEVIESARADGAGEFRIFNSIVLPMIKPAVAVQAIFSFVFSWNNYFVPNLVIDTDSKKTIPILIAQLRNADYASFDMGQIYMIICIAILPILIVYLFLSKGIISGITSGSVKG
jgi:multiple sugar transport system permease protein